MELKEIVDRICDGLVSVDKTRKSKTVLILITETTSKASDVWESTSLGTKSSVGGTTIIQIQKWIGRSNIRKMVDGNVT